MPTPRFATKFSTWNPVSHAAGAHPQNCMFEQPRSQVSDMHFDRFPDLSTVQCWKTSFETEVCSCSTFPTEAMLLTKEVEMVESVDDLKTSQSSGGRRFPNFEMLDAKIPSALKKDHQEPGRPIFPWKTDCVHDLRLFTCRRYPRF